MIICRFHLRLKLWRIPGTIFLRLFDIYAATVLTGALGPTSAHVYKSGVAGGTNSRARE